jgi:hypothetical protein
MVAALHGLEALPVPEAVARLAALRDSLATSNDPEALTALARAIPARVARLAPDVALLLADIAARLVPYGPTVPSDIDALVDAKVRVAWLRVALQAGRSSGDLDELTLLHILNGWSIQPIDEPQSLLARVGRATDIRLRSLTPSLVEAAVQHLAITGEEAFAILAPIAASDPDPTLRERAIRLLGSFWLVGLSPGGARRRDDQIHRALRDPDPNIARAAIEVAPRRWLVDLLREPVSTMKAAALEALAPLANASDLDLALELGVDNTLELGPAVRRFLLEAHRHGVFLRDEHIEAVLVLFDEHRAWTGEELVRVTYIARKELVKRLAELPADDPRWTRRADILAASLKTGAHLVLEELLDRLDPAESRTWPIASAALQAAALSPELAGEERLLRFLEVLPEDVLPALRVKGGPAAVAALRPLVRNRFTPRALRKRLMDVLWALEPDRRGLLTDLAKALPPEESGLLDSKYLTSRDSTAAELLRETPSGIAPIEQLKIYCEAGDIRFLADVTRLFREAFRAYVRKSLEGDFTIKRLLMPTLEQLVFRYGRHVVKDGRSVRRYHVETGPETGRDLVLLLVTDWLHDPVEPPSDPIIVALLETASRHAPDGVYLRLIEPFWRRGDANVKRAAIEALVAAGAGARGLELSLGRLAAEAQLDSRILTQALAAVRTLRATWAEPIVRDVLERREMAVKREAADALAEIGTSRSVPALVSWIGRHDNASFRDSLLRALAQCAGPAVVLVLVDALERVFREPDGGEARTKELLLDALSARISLTTVLRLARSDLAAHRLLVDACLEGKVTVVGATTEQLAAHLHRAKLRKIEPKTDPAKRMRIEGFSPEAARELVARRREKPAEGQLILAVVRSTLADWIGWAASSDVDEETIALILDAADRSHSEHLPKLVELVERSPSSRTDVLGFFERTLAHAGSTPELLALKIRAIGLVRAFTYVETGGLRRWHLLGRLGAVRTTNDLSGCLHMCDAAPNVASESLAVLMDAFAIPVPPAKPESDYDRELAKLYEEAKSLYRAPSPMAFITRVAALRPIDLPPLPRPPDPPAKPAFKPASEADLEALLHVLEVEELPAAELTRAAERILDWPDAAARTWERVLVRWIEGIDLPALRVAVLANALETWPAVAKPSARHVQLAARLNDRQLRAFVPAFLAAWENGDATGELLEAIGQERLLPFVIARALRGSFAPVRLLRRSAFGGAGASAAFDALLALTKERAPFEAKHLLSTEKPAEAADAADPVDPIEDKTLDELVALLDRPAIEKGLAVRAVHALARRFGERSIAPLARFAVDRRAQIRSAALRALRTVASKEKTLEVTSLALKMEPRRDVALGLMASLGHGRHEPALPALLERLADRDYRIRQGAREALLAWGREIIPALRHAARRARPDRRPIYAALIDELS